MCQGGGGAGVSHLDPDKPGEGVARIYRGGDGDGSSP